MKNIFFLSGLPRAGNTLLSSILNQNKNIACTANSILPNILYYLDRLIENITYKNFPDQQSLNNVTKNVFNNYYNDWTAKYIIDRSVWGTPANLRILKTIINKPKIIILTRPTLECLSSYVKAMKPNNVEEFCNLAMSQNGFIGKAIFSINNLITNKYDYLHIKYYDFIKNPNKEIQRIYKYLNIPNYKHNYNNIKEFKVNNLKYNDSVLKVNFHKLNANKIIKKKRKIDLPLTVINKYKNENIWEKIY